MHNEPANAGSSAACGHNHHHDHGHDDHAHHLPQRSGVISWKLIAGWLFVIAAVAPLLLAQSNESMRLLSTAFVSIVLEALPFVMLGSLVGGIIEVFVSREAVSKLFKGRSSNAAFLSALMGVVFPVCECAVIPVTRRLLHKGVPFSVAVAYLLAGPIVNPLVAASTAMAYGWNWRAVAIRLGLGYIIAVTVALVVGRFFPGKSAILSTDALAEEPDAQHVHAPAQPRRGMAARVMEALSHAADDFLYVGQFLIIGAYVAGLCQMSISREGFVALAQTPALTILLMMLLAIALNLCSEADAFVAASFQGILPFSAQMSFMVLGPMLDIKLIAMYLSFVKKRALALMIGLMVILVFTLTLLLHMVITTS